VKSNFAALSEPFVRASGGKRSKIALLMLPRSQRFEATYRDAWLKAGAGEVTAICPPVSLVLETEQLRTLKQSTGFFMAGGSTSLYQKIYGTKNVSRLVRELHAAGVPYGGVSAGAMMACGEVVVEGSTIKTRTNEFQLVADSSRASFKPAHPGVIVRKGLGLVQNCVLEPHFAEWGHFPRIVEAMNLTGSRFGVGLDSSICLQLRDGKRATVRGRGRLYFFRRGSRGARGLGFQVRLYEPGARFEFSTR
jgi:cyanophycinase